VADNIHAINDDRTPQEKLAEYVEVYDQLKKMAETGDVNPNQQHQTQKALPESDPPAVVTTDNSGTGVGGSTAIPSEETNTPGESLDAGESGAATPGHQSPKVTVPNEKPNPQDAATAMETNQEMMMPEQPEDVLKQSSALQRYGVKTPQQLAVKVAAAEALLTKASQAGIPPKYALAFIRNRGDDSVTKIAEDALFPAQISGGTEPLLQSEPGVPSALMQGSEAGSNTPRETAPTSGEGGGRELLASNEAAINATKRSAKSQNKSALTELLTEPSMSAAHDKTLQQSLDNASSAGVKISSAQANAARELLRKFAASPDGQQKLAALAKLAQDPDMAPGGGLPPGEEEPVTEEEAVEAAPEVSDEALAAAEAGVTPEEVAEAEAILAEQGEAAAQEAEAMDAAAAEEAAPEAGDEKDGQMGAQPMAPPMVGGGGQMGTSTPPTPAMT